MQFTYLFVGPFGAGKTSLCRMYLGKEDEEERPTQEIEIYRAGVTVRKAPVTLTFLDTPSFFMQDPTKFSEYFQKVDAIVLCFPVSDPNAFETVKQWGKTEVKDKLENGAPLVFVGTKVDLRTDSPSSESADPATDTDIDVAEAKIPNPSLSATDIKTALENQFGAGQFEYFESSARDKNEVIKLFNNILRILYIQKLQQQKEEEKRKKEEENEMLQRLKDLVDQMTEAEDDDSKHDTAVQQLESFLANPQRDEVTQLLALLANSTAGGGGGSSSIFYTPAPAASTGLTGAIRDTFLHLFSLPFVMASLLRLFLRRANDLVGERIVQLLTWKDTKALTNELMSRAQFPLLLSFLEHHEELHQEEHAPGLTRGACENFERLLRHCRQQQSGKYNNYFETAPAAVWGQLLTVSFGCRPIRRLLQEALSTLCQSQAVSADEADKWLALLSSHLRRLAPPPSSSSSSSAATGPVDLATEHVCEKNDDELEFLCQLLSEIFDSSSNSSLKPAAMDPILQLLMQMSGGGPPGGGLGQGQPFGVLLSEKLAASEEVTEGVLRLASLPPLHAAVADVLHTVLSFVLKDSSASATIGGGGGGGGGAGGLFGGGGLGGLGSLTSAPAGGAAGASASGSHLLQLLTEGPFLSLLLRQLRSFVHHHPSQAGNPHPPPDHPTQDEGHVSLRSDGVGDFGRCLLLLKIIRLLLGSGHEGVVSRLLRPADNTNDTNSSSSSASSSSSPSSGDGSETSESAVELLLSLYLDGELRADILKVFIFETLTHAAQSEGPHSLQEELSLLAKKKVAEVYAATQGGRYGRGHLLKLATFLYRSFPSAAAVAPISSSSLDMEDSGNTSAASDDKSNDNVGENKTENPTTEDAEMGEASADSSAPSSSLPEWENFVETALKPYLSEEEEAAYRRPEPPSKFSKFSFN